MSEWTPGPWERRGADVFRPGKDGANICTVSSPRGSRRVGYTELGIGDPDIREAFANAQLIAASPDLLTACESALAMLDELFPADVFTGESGDRGAVLIAENRARLQAAIAKAKGDCEGL